jgi:hypothetical protein
LEKSYTYSVRSASCSKSTLQGLEAALVVTERAAGDRGERFWRIAAIKLTRLSRRRWTPSVPQLPQRVLTSPQIDREGAFDITEQQTAILVS